MRVITLAAALAALAVPAFADTPWTATPVQPSSQSGFVADSVVWSCGGSGCWSQSDTSAADPMSECVGLARQVGPLSSFADSRASFSTGRLAHCNEGAPKPRH
jgi:hypothetical protein